MSKIMHNNEQQIISGSEFYKKSLVKQKEIVNSCINEAMISGNPIVTLPGNLFDRLKQDIKKAGWYFKSENPIRIYPYYYTSRVFGSGDIESLNGIVTATEFYKVNLTRQRQILAETITNAIETGQTEVKLSFDTYDIVREEMQENGWSYSKYCEGSKDVYNAVFTPCRKDETVKDDNKDIQVGILTILKKSYLK